MGLREDEVNVICAKNSDNERKMRTVEMKLGKAPKREDKPKPITFITKAAYEGIDLYNENAYTYVCSEINRKHLAIDIAIDLPQLMGRQRNPNNIFRNSATIFYKTPIDSSPEAENRFFEETNFKVDETQEAIRNFNALSTWKTKTRLARKYMHAQAIEQYEFDYISFTQDIFKKWQICFNQYAYVNELRCWQLQKLYISGRILYGAIYDAFQGSTPEHLKVNEFLLHFTGTFEVKMKKFALFLQANPECTTDIMMRVEVPLEMKLYFKSIPIEHLSAVSWKESDIKKMMTGQPQDLVGEIRSAFTTGTWYSLKEVKTILQEIYDIYIPGRTAKASDLNRFATCIEKKKKDEYGNRINGILVSEFYETLL